MTTAKAIEGLLFSLGKEEKRIVLQRFFKTSKGEYGEGDVFLGVTVPMIRSVVKDFCNEIELREVEALLMSEFHECRMAGVLLLVDMFKKASRDVDKQGEIYAFYIAHHRCINNWDLVDLSAPNIVGEYLMDRDKSVLKEYANSTNLWLQRISIVSTLFFIRNAHYETTLIVSKELLCHHHDLIHKAVGWMLREVGKRDMLAEESFLLEDGRYKTLPRTMLRYAIEKFDEPLRQQYLRGEV